MNIAIPVGTRFLPKIEAALELKCFIGQERANQFGLDHPLGQGYRALRKFLVEVSLLTAEMQALANLNMNAETILRDLRGVARDHELRSDLCNSDRCRALLFEAQVAIGSVLNHRQHQSALPQREG